MLNEKIPKTVQEQIEKLTPSKIETLNKEELIVFT